MAVPAAQPARCRVCERLGGRAADWWPLQWLGPIRRVPGSRDGSALTQALIQACLCAVRSAADDARRAGAGMDVRQWRSSRTETAAWRQRHTLLPGGGGRCSWALRGWRFAVCGWRRWRGVACRARRAPFRFNFSQSAANPARARAMALALGRFHFHDAHDVDMAGAERGRSLPPHRGAGARRGCRAHPRGAGRWAAGLGVFAGR